MSYFSYFPSFFLSQKKDPGDERIKRELISRPIDTSLAFSAGLACVAEV